MKSTIIIIIIQIKMTLFLTRRGRKKMNGKWNDDEITRQSCSFCHFLFYWSKGRRRRRRRRRIVLEIVRWWIGKRGQGNDTIVENKCAHHRQLDIEIIIHFLQKNVFSCLQTRSWWFQNFAGRDRMSEGDQGGGALKQKYGVTNAFIA